MWSPLALGGKGGYAVFRSQEAPWLATNQTCSSCVTIVDTNGSTAQPEGLCGVSRFIDGTTGKNEGISRAVSYCEGHVLSTADFRYCGFQNRSTIVFGPNAADTVEVSM